ncbi:MAG: DUF4326 domain-containing protein [Anaerolinea sp.]|nr:DUF4326 domain-containing protein [Anaerolinea sp.]
MPVVVNFHDYKSEKGLRAAFGDDWMYVGRRNAHYGLVQSPLANPFAARETTNAKKADDPIASYRRWLWQKMLQRDPEVVEALESISPTMALVCWCNPKPCHAEVIAEASRWWQRSQSVSKPAPSLPRVALSVRQPWAWLLLRPDVTVPEARVRLYRRGEIKDVENRTWVTAARGAFLVHAAKMIDEPGYDLAQKRYPDIPLPAPDELETGGIVGVANLVTMVTESSSRWFFGPKGFVLRDARPLPFAPLRGMQKFFKVDVEALYGAR